MANNGQIKIQIGGDASQFTQAAGQAGSAAAGFGKAIGAAGAASEHAFDEIAAGAAAMDRITAAIGKMVGAALAGDTGLDKFASTAIKAITPLSTFERRLEEINTAIGRIGTVQGAAQLGVQFDLLNRNLQDTRKLIDDATKSAIGLSRAFATVSTASTSLNRLSPAIRPALNDLKLVPPAANAAAASLARIKPGASQAGAALTDVGRILQDLPFGFVSIQNNITQLPDSFKRLRDATGSTGGALKALAGSLMGAGGIGLLLSAVTSALTIATVGWDAWTRILGKSKKEAKEAAEATEKLLKSLKSIEEITADATGGVQGQIVQVQALASVVTNTNAAYNERKRALEELKQVNKAYFGDLKLESITTENLTTKVNEYTKALVNQAVVKGFSDELGRVSSELFKQSQETEKARTKLRQLEDQLKKTARTSSNAQGVVSQSAAYQKLVDQVVDAREAFKTQRDTEEQLATNRAQLTVALNNATVEGLKFLDISGKTTAEHEKQDATLKALRKELAGYEKELADSNELRRKGALLISDESKALTLQLKIFDTLNKIDAREVAVGVKPKLQINPRIMKLQIQEAIKESGINSGSPITVPLIITPRPLFSNQFSPADIIAPEGIAPNAFDGVVNALRSSAERAKVQATKIIIDLKDLLSGVLINAFTGLGESLGAAFASGGFSNVINGFISVIGDAISALGKAAIQAGTAALLLKKTLQKFIVSNPALVIAAGVAAVAIGSALKNAFNNTKVPGFADGITNFSGGAALVGERGPEIVTLPAGANVIPNNPFDALSNITLASQIRGDDIFLSYNRTSGRRRRV